MDWIEERVWTAVVVLSVQTSNGFVCVEEDFGQERRGENGQIFYQSFSEELDRTRQKVRGKLVKFFENFQKISQKVLF